MQASTWIYTYQMQKNKVHEPASPTCVLLLSKNFDPSLFLNVVPSLSMSMFKPTSHILYLCTNFSPFVINFYKKYVIPIKSLDTNWKSVHLIMTNDCIWGRWLRLESCMFYGHNHMCWNDIICIALEIPHRIFDLDTIWWGTSPYIIAWVIHLTILLVRELLFSWWSLKVEDHLWNHLLVW